MNNNDIKIIKLLYENREGLRAKTIGNLCSLKTRNLYNHLNKLREKQLISNQFPIWKILNGGVDFCAKLLKSDKIFELHNVGYVIKLPRVPEWWKTRKNRLLKLKGYQFKSVDWGKNSSNPFLQLSNDQYVIQTYPESIIIIHRKRYYSTDPHQVAIDFLQDFYDLWAWFEERMKFKFFLEGVPQMELRGHHFNRVNDWVANKIKESDSKFLVELDKNRKVWVDMSEPFGKEANYPTGQEKLEKLTKDILTKDSYLPSEMKQFIESTQNQISQVTQNQRVFDANMMSHLEVLQNIGKAITELREEVKKLNGKPTH